MIYLNIEFRIKFVNIYLPYILIKIKKLTLNHNIISNKLDMCIKICKDLLFPKIHSMHLHLNLSKNLKKNLLQNELR